MKRPALFPLIVAIGVLVLGLYLVKLDPQRSAHHVVACDRSACSRLGDRHALARTRRRANCRSDRFASGRNCRAACPAGRGHARPGCDRTVFAFSHRTGGAARPTGPSAKIWCLRLTKRQPGDDNQVEVVPVRLTYVRVEVDGALQPFFDGWLDPSHAPLAFHGRHVTMRVLDRGAVQITKNGDGARAGDADITVE